MLDIAQLLLSRDHHVTVVIGHTIPVHKNFPPRRVDFVYFNSSEGAYGFSEEVKNILSQLAFNPSILDFMAEQKLDGLVAAYGYGLFEDARALSRFVVGQYDLVILDGDILPFLILAHKLAVPYIVLVRDCYMVRRRVPIMASYVPFIMTSYSDVMDFKQRFINFLHMVAVTLSRFGGSDIVQKYMPEFESVTYDSLVQKSLFRIKRQYPGFPPPWNAGYSFTKSSFHESAWKVRYRAPDVPWWRHRRCDRDLLR